MGAYGFPKTVDSIIGSEKEAWLKLLHVHVYFCIHIYLSVKLYTQFELAELPYSRVIKRMCLYLRRKHTCAYKGAVLNNKVRLYSNTEHGYLSLSSK